MEIRAKLERICCNNIAACTDHQLYVGLLTLVKDMAKEKEVTQGKKKVYYNK